MTALITYNAEPTPSRFHASRAFYRCMRGPVRSGKSTSMCAEIMARAIGQAPGPAGIRRTRFAVIRNTYRELEDTTMKTWLMWFPESVFGKVNRQRMTHRLRFNDVDSEVMFRALDRPDDIAKLLSLELTAAWINEAREVPKAVVDMIGDRVEQYPPASEEGCTWGGVMMDTNAPDEDHWWFDLEANPPEGWEFFRQPGALMEIDGEFVPNPEAENIGNLNGGIEYYLKRMAGKTASYIRVYYCNQFGFVEEGKRVHPEYSDAVHTSDTPLEADPKLPLYIGLDFGLTPAATIGQRQASGQWFILHEIVTERIGIRHFGQMLLLPLIIANYLDYDLGIYGDPSGADGSTGNIEDRQTPFEILESIGLSVEKAPSQDPILRREALAAPLTRMIDGRPGVLIDPSCTTLRKGLSSKFVYRRLKVVGDERFQDKPDKNFWSHVCESAQYMMLGAGEGETITHKTPAIDFTKRQRSPRGRSGSWMGA